MLGASVWRVGALTETSTTPLTTRSGQAVVAAAAVEPVATQARSQQLPALITHSVDVQAGMAHSMRHVDGGLSAQNCAVAVVAMAASAV